MNAKILRLALEALEHRKTGIEKEIAEIQAELKGTGSSAPQATQSRSERMKAYWAAKRAGSIKIAKPKVARKRRQKTAAEKEALSKKLKAAWAKRKTKA
jgi:hypothetical protein